MYYWRHLSLFSSGLPKVSELITLRTTNCQIWRQPLLSSTWFCVSLEKLRNTTQPVNFSNKVQKSHTKPTAADAD